MLHYRLEVLQVDLLFMKDSCFRQWVKGGQPPHHGLIAEKCISPLSEEIFSSNFQH